MLTNLQPPTSNIQTATRAGIDRVLRTLPGSIPDGLAVFLGDPCGNRTHVSGVRGRCLNRLTNGPISELED